MQPERRVQKLFALVVISFCFLYLGVQALDSTPPGYQNAPKTEITECHFLLKYSHVDQPGSETLLLAAAEALEGYLPSDLANEQARAAFLKSTDEDQALARLESIVDSIQKTHQTELGPHGAVYLALEGMVGALSDPYTKAMDPDTYRKFKEGLHSRPFGGVGLQLGREEKEILVFAVLPDTPAARAGVLAGDTLVAVEEKAVEELAVEEVESLLRGDVGSDVFCRFRRVDKEYTRTLQRVQLHTRSVRGRLVATDHGFSVGWLSIDTFQDSTARELEEEIDKLLPSEPAGLILDLRDNVGGYVKTALQICSLFLDSGKTVVHIESPDGKEERQTVSARQIRLPLVLLVNKRTASSAEIVTACLQDYGRAKVAGEKTFGKGSVQSLHEFESGGGLKFTTARYTTPNHRLLDGHGLLPDRILEEEDILIYCYEQWTAKR